MSLHDIINKTASCMSNIVYPKHRGHLIMARVHNICMNSYHGDHIKPGSKHQAKLYINKITYQVIVTMSFMMSYTAVFCNLAKFWYACVNLKATVRAAFLLQHVSGEAFNDAQCQDNCRTRILCRHGLNSITSIQKLTHARQNPARL